MTAKIIPIRNPGPVEALESLLERARRGEFKAIAFAAVLEDGCAAEGWAGKVDECTFALYGAINTLRDVFFHEHIDHFSDADRGLRPDG